MCISVVYIQAADIAPLLERALQPFHPPNEATSQVPSTAELEETLLAIPLDVMMRVLPSLVGRYAEAWTLAMTNLSPLGAEALTMLWEDEDGTVGEKELMVFCGAVMGGPGVDGERIQQHLVQAKDKFARDATMFLLEGAVAGP